jgi:hypothetical protein
MNLPIRLAPVRALLSVFALIVTPSFSFSQQRTPVCTRAALAALMPMPKLRYACGDQPNEWDDKALKRPERVAAIRALVSQLSKLSNSAWWEASTEELSMCDFRHTPGALTEEQRQTFAGDYWSWLFGDHHIRLLLIPDPCYQTEYSGSNAFLLYRKSGKVFVSQVLDGYYTRAENSVGIALAKLNRQEIVEVSTNTGGLHPDVINYYFVIDPKTDKAVPKKLFQGDHGPTNIISSAMLFNAPNDLDLPADAAPLNIIRGHSLAKSFSVYSEVKDGKIEDSGRTFSRTVLKWDGKLYR